MESLLQRLKAANPIRYSDLLDLLREIVPQEEQLAALPDSAKIRLNKGMQKVPRRKP